MATLVLLEGLRLPPTTHVAALPFHVIIAGWKGVRGLRGGTDVDDPWGGARETQSDSLVKRHSCFVLLWTHDVSQEPDGFD